MMKPALISTFALSLLLTPLPLAPSHAAQNSKYEAVEVAFVLDTTGSMADLIDGAKQKIWSIANSIVDVNPNADIRMALIAYRDYGDQYVTKRFDMSNDIQGLYSYLLSLRADGGGDNREAVNEALEESIDDIKWQHDPLTQKIVFLVGDAPPHMDYDNGPKYPDTLHAAVRRGIKVHAVQAGISQTTEEYWRDIAQRGGGRYIPIPQDGGQISQIETPYDADILRIQKQLDDTVVPYGSREKQAAYTKKLSDKALGSLSSRVENSAFYAKKGGKKEVMTGGVDLVAEVRNGDVDLEEVAKTDLPEAMQNMPLEEQEAYISEIVKKRKVLESDMVALVEKRDAYIKDKSATMADSAEQSFDKAVIEVLK